MENTIRISVRNLIEFTMRSGDINTGYVSSSRAVEGIRAHQKLQKEYGDNYTSEYFMHNETIVGGMVFVIEGRADGVIREEGRIIIDEIKSTTRDLETIEEDYNMLHWAQVYCYAYFYAIDHNMETISVQLSYYNLDEDRTKRFLREMTTSELWEFYGDLLSKYLEFSKKLLAWRKERDESIPKLDFPFQQYRKGQREMAVAVYKTIKEGRLLLVDAPTGIGKTISSLFPAVKAIGEQHLDKIFYLTARSTTKEVCTASMKLMRERGLHMKSIVLTAKEKSCLNEEIKCNPMDCSYAKGHFDRVNDAIIDILDSEELIDYKLITEYSKKHMVCPFEYQLDIAVYSDLIICDYNYVFDPRVYLRRFFEGNTEEFALLVDEAHNLIDRGRSMFSAELSQKGVLDIKDIIPDAYPQTIKAYKRLLTGFEAMRRLPIKNRELAETEAPEKFYYLLRAFTSSLDVFLEEEKKLQDYDKVLNLYFEIRGFQRIYDIYDSSYLTLYTLDDEDKVTVKLLCVDTHSNFKIVLERARSTIYFSATLSPMDYYLELLGGDTNTYKYHIKSPFDQRNLFLAAMVDISTKYADRENSIAKIIETLETTVSVKPGNYLVFFPSYTYMQRAYDDFILKNPEFNVIAQERGMSEQERDEFLRMFEIYSDIIAFAVMGGVFSEGIDLVGEKLIGTIIVSVGIPMISFERDTIMNYFNEKGSKGFEYAYMYPGMNKVLQAAGRVIRSKDDKGIAILIDSRFASRRYRMLMPKYWSHIVNYYESESLEEGLTRFYDVQAKN